MADEKEVKRYVVTVEDHIVGGPYLWDGETEWTPPEVGKLELESDYLTRMSDE